MAGESVAEVTAELAALDDPRVREVNERHGDDRAGCSRGEHATEVKRAGGHGHWK